MTIVKPLEWAGTPEELTALLVSFDHHCTCNGPNARPLACAHRLLSSGRHLALLLGTRRDRRTFETQEHDGPPPSAPSGVETIGDLYGW